MPCAVCREERIHSSEISGSLCEERSIAAQTKQQLCSWKTPNLNFLVYTKLSAVENLRAWECLTGL